MMNKLAFDRTIRLSGFLLVLLLLAGSPVPASGLALAPGDPAPEMRGTDGTGERRILDYTKNTFTLINFWATWCEPCKLEMPALERLQQERGDAGLQIVGVMIDQADHEEMGAFAEELELSYLMLKPQQRYVKAWGGINSMPTSFLIDGTGKILRRYVGATPEQIDGLTYDVTAVLDGKPLGPYVFASGGSVNEADRQALQDAKKE